MAPLLTPCHKLRRHWWKRPNFSEQCLTRSPNTLNDLITLVSRPMVLWITEDSFLAHEVEELEDCPREYYQQHKLRVIFSYFDDRNKFRSSTLNIHAATKEHAQQGLNYLYTIPDCFYTEMCLQPGGDIESHYRCPVKALGDVLPMRETNVFHDMRFDSQDQSQALASLPNGTLIMTSCSFSDGGSWFADAFAAQSPHAKKGTLTIRNQLPFDQENWVRFLNILEGFEDFTLELRDLSLKDEGVGKALADLRIKSLNLIRCHLDDQGGALTDCLLNGKGPRHLVLETDWDSPRSVFEKEENWLSFAKALHSCRLEGLDLNLLDPSEAFLQVFAKALCGNTHLTRLCLTGLLPNHDCWAKLVQALAQHPSLYTIRLPQVQTGRNMRKSEQQLRRTRVVADMLDANHEIHEILRDDDDTTFDHGLWCSMISPHLDYNQYQKKIAAADGSLQHGARAALVGKALANVSEKTHLIWALLTHNQDTVVSYL